MNILDGSWMSFDKNNLFHEAVDCQQAIRSAGDGMASLDRSTNGHLDNNFFSSNKGGDQSLNDSLKFMNRSANLNEQSRLLNSSARSIKQAGTGFQPFQRETSKTVISDRTRIPAMCIANKMDESDREQQEQLSEKSQRSQRSQRSQKSEFVLANYKLRDEESIEAQIRSKKNQTKNIPKNYGKAIISFMQKNKAKILELFGPTANEHELVHELKSRKRTINTIRDIRDLWTKSKFSKEFRIISNLFLRKYAFQYIFNSRITNYSSHIKYKHKLREAVVSPESFICIKDKDY